jgi:DNA/RNA-binding domain of Phe-tRNA-synthetase-like protein
MNLSIAPDLSSHNPSLGLGLLSLRGLKIRAKDDALWQMLEQVGADFAARCGVNAIASDPRIVAVRRMFKAVGVDPSRYRPSSEALARRVAQGRGLYQINTAVDVNNWGSLEERLPFGIYDASLIEGDVLLRLGREGEAYEGIGKSLIALEGKLLLADGRGAFGSPISDSTRAMVTVQTRDIHLVVFANEVSREELSAILQRTSERMMRYNAGRLERIEVNP